jgi:hypothetical protein
MQDAHNRIDTSVIANCHCPLVRLTLITRAFQRCPPPRSESSQRESYARSEARQSAKLFYLG